MHEKFRSFENMVEVLFIRNVRRVARRYLPVLERYSSYYPNTSIGCQV